MSENETYKIVLKIEHRPDGGIRVWSDDVPGLVLSNKDARKVLEDIKPTIELILSEALGCRVEARPLERLQFASAAPARTQPRTDFAHRALPVRKKTLEFAALACA